MDFSHPIQYAFIGYDCKRFPVGSCAERPEFKQQAPVYGRGWNAMLHNGALSNESKDNVCPFFLHYAFNFFLSQAHTVF